MSMSQEEIEALMNGLDISDDESESSQTEQVEEPTEVNIDEIEELISETKVEETNSLDEDNSVLDNSDIDALLNEIEFDSSDSEVSVEEPEENNIEIPVVQETKVEEKVEVPVNNEALVKDWTDSQINEGVFPLPAEQDTKVVNQLSQVANDSEEKVSQIFDVLSATLDNNNDIRNRLKQYDSFVDSQIKLLNSLSAKFPNIDVFKGHLSVAQDVSSNMKELAVNIGNEDMQIFEAMELMQFNDINRQKIERVMSVIRKLSIYLNNLFEDDGSTKEVAVAKHIHGDHNDDLMNDDELNKLIAEFEK